MRLSSLFIISGTFLAAAAVSLLAASYAVTLVEESSEIGVRQAFDENGLTWAEVHADGLKVYVNGTAKSEADRFFALATAGSVVDAARVIDKMKIKVVKHVTPPRFSIEILRNDSGISLIGLIPAATDRDAILEEMKRLVGDGTVTDFLEVADYPVPPRWDDALRYGLQSLTKLPRSKISIDARHVAITAMSDSVEAKRRIESELTQRAPHNMRVTLDISAPRPVITPFSLRFLIDEDGARFDSCSADTPEASARILRAALAAGMTERATCTLGLGVPSPNWAKAADMAIKALAELGAGSVTFADADITMVAAEGTDQALFDRVVGQLENDLPEVFALHAVLPKPPDAKNEGPPEFVATRSPEGLVQMRGRISDKLSRETAVSFAKARFSSGDIHSSARIDTALPANWQVRVLTGLDALAKLSNGAVTITPSNVSVSGNTGDPDAKAEISRLLSKRLGEKEAFSIDVTYQKKLDPVAGLPTPDECIAQIKEIQAKRKISFEPGSDTIDGGSRKSVDAIAEVLKKCGPIKLEVGGHTDSQGRETMNQQLSLARAQAVLNGLRARRVLTSSFTAVGYGETKPIADNGTEEGREENRRIEFTLIKPEPSEDTQTTLESIEDQNNSGDDADTMLNEAQDEGTPDDTD
jgi:OOP family OmpA-OmpF porin